MSIKNKLYFLAVTKNENIRKEYEGYVRPNHGRLRSWWELIRLNFHYRILRKRTPMFARSASPRPTEPKVKLPYLNGSESKDFARSNAIWLAKDLLNADVVSFDIFDTLILRPFAAPTNLFMIVGNKLNMMDFSTIRIEAEREARAISWAERGTNEITIYDIYDVISRRTGIDRDHGVEVEFNTEIDYCFANPYMQRIYKILMDQKKEVIIVSDMYYPHDMMEKLLESCGYTGYSKLYVSCDYLCCKRTGGLYKNVLRDYHGMKITHVGDNVESDINSAKSNGMNTFYYKNCHEIGNPYRADGLSELVGSFYSGIVNTHLHNGIKEYSPYYEYGFIYGGLYILGYCNWIYQKAKKEGIDKVLFLARDGYIYQKVFNMLYDDMPNEYVFWSRITNTRSTIEINKADFLKRNVTNKALLPEPYTMEEILIGASLDNLIQYLPFDGLKTSTLLVPDLIKKVENFFITYWDKVVESYSNEERIQKQVFAKMLAGCKKAAVIDVGWLGTGPMGIKYLVEDKWQLDCEIKCYVAAAFHGKPAYNINEITNEIVEPYIFSRFYNRNHFDVHCNTNKGMNNAFFELFTQACHPSFVGLTKEGDYIFDIAEVSNYEITNEIHEGIIDFCKIYIDKCKYDPYLMRISGYDAYCPFRHIRKNLKFIKTFFSDYGFSFEVGCGNNIHQITIGDALKKRGL